MLARHTAHIRIHRRPQRVSVLRRNPIARRYSSVADGEFVYDSDHGLRVLHMKTAEEIAQFKSSCKTTTNESPAAMLSFLPRRDKVLPPQAIVGWLRSFPPIDKKRDILVIEPANFIENPTFRDFLHQVISKHVYDSPSDIERAQKAQGGWLHIPDSRSHLGLVRVIPEEIFGSVLVQDGVIVRGSYTSMDLHRLVTADGVFRLEEFLHNKLLEEIESLAKQ